MYVETLNKETFRDTLKFHNSYIELIIWYIESFVEIEGFHSLKRGCFIVFQYPYSFFLSSPSQALEGLWQVDILDHGSIIVAAPYFFSAENGSTLLMYSCDEGLSWTPLNYTDTPVHVGGLRTEQGKTTTSLMLVLVDTPQYIVYPEMFAWQTF